MATTTRTAAAATTMTSAPELAQEITFSNGDKFLGKVQHGVPHGKGIYTSAHTGDCIEAEFRMGHVHGQGTLTKTNGDFFAGLFQNDRMEHGTYLYANRNNSSTGAGETAHAVRYRGGFRDNLPHGNGTLEFSNGDTYEGTFEKGRAHGVGRYVSFNGNVLAGQFERGKAVRGSKQFKSGDRFVGEFTSAGECRFQGLGRLEFANGDAYCGQFSNGSFHGQGNYYFGASGLVLSCSNWVKDEPVGVCEVTWPQQGAYFVGTFFSPARKTLVEAKGVLHFADGAWLESNNQNSALYYDKKVENKTWTLLPGWQQQKHAGVLWLAISNALGGLKFSAEGAPQENNGGLAAAMLLAVHQRVQFDLHRQCARESYAWVTNNKSVETDLELLSKLAKAMLGAGSEAKCAVALLGSAPKPEQLSQLMLEVQGNLAALDLTNSALRWFHSNGVENIPAAALSIETAIAKQKPELLVLCMQTGVDQQHLIHTVLNAQTTTRRTLLVWCGGNAAKVAQSAAECGKLCVDLCNN